KIEQALALEKRDPDSQSFLLCAIVGFACSREFVSIFRGAQPGLEPRRIGLFRLRGNGFQKLAKKGPHVANRIGIVFKPANEYVVLCLQVGITRILLKDQLSQENLVVSG